MGRQKFKNVKSVPQTQFLVFHLEMASLPLTSLSDTSGFDWNSEDNCVKWKGQFVRSLERVLYQTHPQFQADEESLSYVESLLVRLMLMITAKPAPSTVSDVEVRLHLPNFCPLNVNKVFFRSETTIDVLQTIGLSEQTFVLF